MRSTAVGQQVIGKTVITIWYVDTPADLASISDSVEGDVAICVSGPIYRRDISAGGWVLKFDPSVGGGGAVWGSVTGTLADQTDLESALDGKAAVSHTHSEGDVTNLTANLAGKASSVHTHAQSDITGLVVDLAAKQPLDIDLTTIAALTATTDNVIQSVAGLWASRTPAQLKTSMAFVKADVGLGSVDNTSDAAKPVSTATQTALDGKQALDADLTTIAGLTATTDNFIVSAASAWASRTPAQAKTSLALVKGDVGLGSVDNTTDASKSVSSAATLTTPRTIGGVSFNGSANITVASATGGFTVTGGETVLAAGTTTTSPLNFPSGTLETTPEVGDSEFDGEQFYHTIDTSSSRGAVPVEQYFHLSATGATIGTIANFFGATSNISLVASAYYIIDIYCFFLNTTAGTVTWTFTNSAAPTSQNIDYLMSPLTGIPAPAGSAAAYLSGTVYNDATAAKALTTSGTLTTAVNHFAKFKIFLRNGAGTSLKIQATKLVGGTITPGINSYWFARRISPNNIGAFAA